MATSKEDVERAASFSAKGRGDQVVSKGAPGIIRRSSDFGRALGAPLVRDCR